MSEGDLRTVLQELSGRSFDTELAQWVHSTAELPLAELLGAHGVQLKPETAQWAQKLGLRVTETHSVNLKTVLRGGLAESAGMAAGDEWLGIEVNGEGWRISKLEDVAFYAGTETTVTALVARDGRLLRLPLSLSRSAKPSRSTIAPAAAVPDTVSLSITDAAAVARWLN